MTNLTADNIAALDKVMQILDKLNTQLHNNKAIRGNDEILRAMETLKVEFQSELIDREQDQEEYIHPDVAAHYHGAFTEWYNGVGFKDYFKILDARGTSLVFEVNDLQVYCEGAEAAAEENFDEAEAHFGSNT